MRKKIIFLTLAATLSSHQSIAFAADAYPSRPIRVITAVGPGGTADIFLRTLGEELTRRWGQPIVVEPQPGATLDIASIRAQLKASLADYKVPKHVEIQANLPREDSGKIFKRRLRDPHWERAGRRI